MKEIELTRGYKAIVDDDIYEKLSTKKWRAQKNYSTVYAITGKGKDVKYMHRVLCEPEKGFVVDHINGNGLDNRRTNLRVVPLSVNRLSAKVSKNNTTGFKGVVFEKRTGKWVSRVTRRIDGKRKSFHLGTFNSPHDAHDAYVAFIKENYGDIFYRTA